VTPPTEEDIRIYVIAERGNPLLIACKVKFIDTCLLVVLFYSSVYLSSMTLKRERDDDKCIYVLNLS
jgi:hypothetical protein